MVKILGVDVANKGIDKSSLCFREDFLVEKFVIYDNNDTVDLSDNIQSYHLQYNFDWIVIDCDGLGIGVYDVLYKRGLPVYEFKGSFSPRDPEYFNARSEAYFNVRNLLNPDPRINSEPLELPPDDDLMHELCSINWDIRNGRKRIEDKKEFKKRLGRSPDKADSLIYAFYPDAQSRSGLWLMSGLNIYGLDTQSRWKKRN